ncbi:MAG: acyl-CoA thioesterase [Acidobacteria bacterium]|nr:acyl-CoA thioesterase [Acidobacteriota bacterium]
MRSYTVELEVRFPEVDSYGVVWHGHYVQYFEVVRNALSAAAGITPRQALEAGYKVPITGFGLNLKRPARLDDRLEVAVTLREPRTAMLVMDYEIRKLPERTLLVTGHTQQVFLSPKEELLLTLPGPVKTLVARILTFQSGGGELTGEAIPLVRPG